jgi:hypothetical protein
VSDQLALPVGILGRVGTHPIGVDLDPGVKDF